MDYLESKEKTMTDGLYTRLYIAASLTSLLQGRVGAAAGLVDCAARLYECCQHGTVTGGNNERRQHASQRGKNKHWEKKRAGQ